MRQCLTSPTATRLPSIPVKFSALLLTFLSMGLSAAPALPDAAPQPHANTASAVDTPRRSVRTLATPCQGRDDTLLLQTALRALVPGETLMLPAGTCRYSAVLRLDDKRDVEVTGAGRETTFLLASNPRRSALVVHRSQGIVLRDFSLSAEHQIARQSSAEARGIYAEHSLSLTVRGLRVAGISGAGILLWDVQGAHLHDNHVHDTLADGIHVTGGARDILMERNLAERTGDDSFASVSYLREQARFGLNQRITIRNNVSIDSWASGIAVEGSTDVTVSGNRIERSGAAGIRIAAIAGEWQTAEVARVTIDDNRLTDVRTRHGVDHAAIMIFADSADVRDIQLHGNRIDNPRSHDAIRIRGSKLGARIASGITIENTATADRRAIAAQCISIGAGYSAVDFHKQPLERVWLPLSAATRRSIAVLEFRSDDSNTMVLHRHRRIDRRFDQTTLNLESSREQGRWFSSHATWIVS